MGGSNNFQGSFEVFHKYFNAMIFLLLLNLFNGNCNDVSYCFRSS